MRNKNRNVQQPPRRSPRKPAATSYKALPVLIAQDHNPTISVFETSSDSDCVGHLNPQKGNNIDEHKDLDSLGLGNCIRCDDSGDLVLFCGGKSCSIAVHEKCMGCDPKFDDLGKFRCPFCDQKLAAALVTESRRKVMEAKKALSSFLEGNSVIVGGGVENGITGSDIERKKRKGLENVVRPNSSVPNGDGDVGSSFKEKGRLEAVEEEEQSGEVKKSGSAEGIDKRVSVENDNTREAVEELEPEASDEIENENSVSETDASAKPPKRFKRRAGKTETEPFLRRKAVAKKSASNRYVKKASTRSKSRAASTISIANFPREKRKRLHWTIEEEEMLSKYVEKYSEGAVNIPWRKILDDGSAVFHKTRVPGDLKEKWRNMNRHKRQ